jgi:predicted phosphodiesterase
MLVALLSDIHGNLVALEAVLADIEQQGGVDAYWVLGDLVALGPDPVGVLERLITLPNVNVTRGNTDRYVCTGVRPQPTLAEAQANPTLVPRLVEVAGQFAWAQGAVTAAGWFEWLDALPLEWRVTLPDGTRFLGVHAAPGTDDGWGIHPDLTDEALLQLLEGCEADLICTGHTHQPLERRLDNYQVVNLGSVSNPLPPDLRASYVLLQADSHGCEITHRRVEYDRKKVILQLEKIRHPGRTFLTRHFRGEILPHRLR